MSWRTVPIGEIGKVFDGPHATPKPSSHGPIFLGIKNIREDGHLDFSEVRHVSPEEYPRWTKRVIPTAGDVVFTYEATLHRYALIPDKFIGCLGRRTALVRPDPTHVDSRFLYYQFRSPQWWSKMEQNKLIGATVDRIPIKKFPEFEINLPDLPVQRRIADILSAYDDLIENNNRRMALLEASIHLLYREWFVYLRFPGYERVKIVDGVPVGWVKKALSELYDTSSGGTPSRKKQGEYYGGEILWIKTKELQDRWILNAEEKLTDAGLKGSSAKLFARQTLIVAMYGATIGKFGVLTKESCTNQACCAVLSRCGSPFTHLFAFAYFFHERLRIISLGQGAAQPNISQKVIRALSILTPPRRIISDFNSICAPLLNQMLLLQRENEAAAAARDLLLPRLMDGRIPV